MAPISGSDLSPLACTSCRRRKIKCDRNLPGCNICSKSIVACVYPAGPLKPGPKLGTPSRSRKRARTGSPEDHTSNVRAQILIPGSTGSSAHEAEEAESLRGHSSAIYSILHPAHGGCISDDQRDNKSRFASDPDPSPSRNREVFSEACDMLDISVGIARELIDVYMSNFCAFSLFHKPSFMAKLHAISSSHALGALLASMFIFSARYAVKPSNSDNSTLSASPVSTLTPAYFERIAMELQDQTLKESGDAPPPLCLLQASILTSFQHLIRGVRGIAWRHLGACIRLAYELDLHRIDSGMCSATRSKPAYDASRAIEDEERRRAWWAIWEMDTFASTIRRSPTAINWSGNETFLPITDAFWYDGTQQSSCVLALKPMARWKNLQKTGNTSCKVWNVNTCGYIVNGLLAEAISYLREPSHVNVIVRKYLGDAVTHVLDISEAWYIVANSLMRDAQALSDPRGLFADSWRQNSTPVGDKSVSESLSIISNSLRCFALALPQALQYHGEYLTFTSSDPNPFDTNQQLHVSIHATHLMIQLTHLMVDHYEAFRLSSVHGHTSTTGKSPPPSYSRQQRQGNLLMLSEQQRQALNRFVLAADNAFTMISRCSDDHTQHVNPFLASLVWIAAAVMLVQKYFRHPTINLELVDFKFEFLRMNYKQYVDFWGTPSILEERLDSLEQQFEKLHGLDNSTTTSITDVEKGVSKENISLENDRLDVNFQNPQQIHTTDSTGLQQSTGPTASGLPQSGLFASQQAPEPNAESTFLAPNVSFQFSNPSYPKQGAIFEEGTSTTYDDGGLNDFGFGVHQTIDGELDFSNFLNTLFSDSYEQ